MNKKITGFIFSQINQIRKNGFFALLRKSRTLFLMILAVPFVLLIRLLRPLVVIRFACLPSSRIGHFAGNTEMYLCERDTGMHPPRTFDIFYYQLPICNYQLKKMWERTGRLRIFSFFPDFMQELSRFNRLLPGGEKHTVLTSARDIHGFRARTKPQLFFTAQEEQFGRNELRKLGIPDGNSFVCFHARDSAYLETALPWTPLLDRKWDYHNHRDSSIHNCILAAEESVRRGYFAVRMGAIVKEKLNAANPRIIDYAMNGRTDFLDIYLGAKCRFFFGDTAGIMRIATLFRRPLACMNFISLEHMHTARDSNYLFIPKKLWLRKQGRFLTFREILNSEIGKFGNIEQFEQARIEVIENTSEEIKDVVIEMDERLKGVWLAAEEDEQLQQRFWALFKPGELNQALSSRIGAKFLRQNRKLLE